MMRRSAGFDANEARRQLLKEWQNVSALELTTNDYITCRVNSVDLKKRLSNIETDGRDRLHVWLLRIVVASTAPLHGTSVPVQEPSTASGADIARQSMSALGHKSTCSARSSQDRLRSTASRSCASWGKYLSAPPAAWPKAQLQLR